MNYRKALGVSAISNLVSFVLGFASVIVVSRLLTPEEIGVFSVAVSILGIAHALREFGVSQYLVQAKEVGEREFRAAFSVTLYTAWTIALVVFFARHPMARFYGNQGIADVRALMALNFMILPLGTPLLALLQRDLAFDKIAIVRICNSTVSAGVTIAAAWAGESYLSMAWGALAGHLSNLVVLNVMRPGKIFVRPQLRGLGSVVRFGSFSTVSTLIYEIGLGMPDMVFGRTLGFAAVAFHSRAFGLQKMLMSHLLTVVRGVYFSSFAKEIRDGKDAAELYTHAMKYFVAIVMPAMAVTALLAEPLILFFFGPQWERSIFLAQVICVTTALASPYTMTTPTLVAGGHVERTIPMQAATEAARALVLISSLWLTLEQVVVALILPTLLSCFLQHRELHRAYSLKASKYFAEIARSIGLVPFTLVLPGFALYLLQPIGQTPAALVLALAICASCAAIGWVAGVFMLDHPFRHEILAITAKFRRLDRVG